MNYNLGIQLFVGLLRRGTARLLPDLRIPEVESLGPGCLRDFAPEFHIETDVCPGAGWELIDVVSEFHREHSESRIVANDDDSRVLFRDVANR
jgi:hypothetical protein